MEAEERIQVRLAALVEAAEVEGEGVRQHQEDEDEDVRERRCEITRELAAHDDAHVAHGAFVPQAVMRAEHLIEASGFQVQILQLEALLRGQLGDRRQDRCCRRAAAPSGAHRARSPRPRPPPAARSAPARAAAELRRPASSCMRDGVVVARARRETRRGVVGDDAAAGDDDRRGVHTASTSSRMCVEMTMILSRAMSLISVRTSCFWFGSSPSVGSSRISTGGSCTIACARPTRRRKPLERVSMVCSSTPPQLQVLDDVRQALAGAARPRAARRSAMKSRKAPHGHLAVAGRALGQVAEAGLGGERVGHPRRGRRCWRCRRWE